MPAGIDPVTAPQPLDPQVANHVVVVGLFGTPNMRTMSFLNQPPVSIRPVYQDKSVQLCVPEDAVCSEGMDFAVHTSR